MAIEYQKKSAVFKDTVGVEEADGLLEWLRKNPRSRIDFSQCQHLHAANLQVIMAVNPIISAWPNDARLRMWLESAIKQH